MSPAVAQQKCPLGGRRESSSSGLWNCGNRAAISKGRWEGWKSIHRSSNPARCLQKVFHPFHPTRHFHSLLMNSQIVFSAADRAARGGSPPACAHPPHAAAMLASSAAAAPAWRSLRAQSCAPQTSRAGFDRATVGPSPLPPPPRLGCVSASTASNDSRSAPPGRCSPLGRTQDRTRLAGRCRGVVPAESPLPPPARRRSARCAGPSTPRQDNGSPLRNQRSRAAVSS